MGASSANIRQYLQARVSIINSFAPIFKTRSSLWLCYESMMNGRCPSAPFLVLLAYGCWAIVSLLLVGFSSLIFPGSGIFHEEHRLVAVACALPRLMG